MMENSINIGELDTLVTVQKAVTVRGAQGEKVCEYQDHSRVWAKVERNINEMVSNANLEESNTIELTCYKIPELTVRWRVVVEGIAYDVTAIDPISRISPLNRLTLSGID